MIRRILEILPGLGLLMGGAVIAFAMAETLGFNELVFAILLGFLLGNVLGIPDWADAGIRTHKVWLETGIVLMGARVALDDLLAIGPQLLVMIAFFIVLTIACVEFLSRNVYGISDQMGSLLAAGASICGVSAVVAVSSGIKAKSEQIAYAIATVLFFDAITLALYPVVGRLLELPDLVFGAWAGISMFSTGPVVAAGFTYSQEAGQWATITKLGRNIFIGFLAIGYAGYYARIRSDIDIDAIGQRWYYIWEKFPKFIIGFFLVIVIVSAGLLSNSEIELLNSLYHWFFLVAFVGLGSKIQLREMRKTGLQPIKIVLTAFITISVLSLLTLLLFYT